MSIDAVKWALGVEVNAGKRMGAKKSTGEPKLVTVSADRCHLVLIDLAERAGTKGKENEDVAWPSVSTMAERLHLHEGTVREALNALEVQGLIRPEGTASGTKVVTRDGQRTKGGRELMTAWRLAVDKPAGKPRWVRHTRKPTGKTRQTHREITQKPTGKTRPTHREMRRNPPGLPVTKGLNPEPEVKGFNPVLRSARPLRRPASLRTLSPRCATFSASSTT